MDSLVSGYLQYGYSILFALVLLEAVGMPVPAALALLIAGGASARGSLHFLPAAACALAALVLGDTLMFLLGRHTGWWLLTQLCRLSFNPENCILRSADSFYRRGRTVLLFAKFVPGINAMAPPLAGSMNMRFSEFLGLDFVGAAFYSLAYLSVGFLFSDALGAITRNYNLFSRALTWALIAAVGGYLGIRVWRWTKARRLPSIPGISPSEAAQALSSDSALIYDVRSHGYYDRKATRVRGSRRFEPNSLGQMQHDFPAEKQVFLYCTCVGDATSSVVARELLEKGVQAAVIRGGLRAWRKAGLPLEPVPLNEISELPVFDAR
jgi:membrane protein DedA with SNARE-associated domain/rhodanese-related sulfurtransferase